LNGSTPADAEIASLRERADKAGLVRRPGLFQVVSVRSGASGLLEALTAALGPAR
jgi:hypothetical protein